MLAGPPRLVSFVSVLLLVGLGWWYIHLSSSGTGVSILPGAIQGSNPPNSQSPQDSHGGSLQSPQGTGMKPDGLDFSIPLRFTDGVAKPPGQNYTKVLVVPKTQKEDISWMESELPEDLRLVVYEVDNEYAKVNRIPKNKGREAMVYLTYLIDNYHALPDTIIFMHAHRHAWHNNQLLGLDASQMLKRLNHDRVARHGYMSMRCHHDPGCPDWIHLDRPGGDFDFFHKPEEIYFRRNVWQEIHPGAPVPQSLSGVCCAQFAVSGDRVRQVPLERFKHYRRWLMETNMDDQYSGRVMEYIWHYIFTGHEVYCPAQNTCYCDGYGFCFGGAKPFQEYFDRQDERNKLNEELTEFFKKEDEERKKGEKPSWNEEQRARRKWLGEKVREMDGINDKAREEAMERGKDPAKRLEETERYDSGEGIWEYLPGRSKGPPE